MTSYLVQHIWLQIWLQQRIWHYHDIAGQVMYEPREFSWRNCQLQCKICTIHDLSHHMLYITSKTIKVINDKHIIFTTFFDYILMYMVSKCSCTHTTFNIHQLYGYALLGVLIAGQIYLQDPNASMTMPADVLRSDKIVSCVTLVTNYKHNPHMLSSMPHEVATAADAVNTIQCIAIKL